MFLKSKFLGVALATYVALGISACDEAKSFIVSASVEKPYDKLIRIYTHKSTFEQKER